MSLDATTSSCCQLHFSYIVTEIKEKVNLVPNSVPSSYQLDAARYLAWLVNVEASFVAFVLIGSFSICGLSCSPKLLQSRKKLILRTISI